MKTKMNYFYFLVLFTFCSCTGLFYLTRNLHISSKAKYLSKNSNSSTIDSSNQPKHSCPIIPPNLNTRIPVNLTEVSLDQTEKDLKIHNIKQGGLFSPADCVARDKVALIIPYRNREKSLKLLIRRIHLLLVKQQIDYGIYLVEPLGNLTFNRGLLMNVGFLESSLLTENKWDCFIFHDIDLLPEDERNIYSCPEKPRHMSSAVSTMNYQLPYESIFGGVSALTRKQINKINGYSNLYFGWGGEDDDLFLRIVRNSYRISRYPLEIGRYYMVQHHRDQLANPERFRLLRESSQTSKQDGLNSIKYHREKVEVNPLFTKILVSYDEKLIKSFKYNITKT